MILKSTISRIALLFFFVNFIFSCENIENTNQERSKININSDWLYLENNTTESDDALKQKDWQPINLPHTWNALDATDLEPGYRRTGSWYKKDLEIPTIVTGQIYQLYFEGAHTKGRLAGSRCAVLALPSLSQDTSLRSDSPWRFQTDRVLRRRQT